MSAYYKLRVEDKFDDRCERLIMRGDKATQWPHLGILQTPHLGNTEGAPSIQVEGVGCIYSFLRGKGSHNIKYYTAMKHDQHLKGTRG
jgi:hypothetical protein